MKTKKVTQLEMTIGTPATAVTLISRKDDSMHLSLRGQENLVAVELAPMKVAALVNSLVSAVYCNENRTIELKHSDAGFIAVTVANWRVTLNLTNGGQTVSVELTRDGALALVDSIHTLY